MEKKVKLLVLGGQLDLMYNSQYLIVEHKVKLTPYYAKELFFKPAKNLTDTKEIFGKTATSLIDKKACFSPL